MCTACSRRWSNLILDVLPGRSSANAGRRCAGSGFMPRRQGLECRPRARDWGDAVAFRNRRESVPRTGAPMPSTAPYESSTGPRETTTSCLRRYQIGEFRYRGDVGGADDLGAS